MDKAVFGRLFFCGLSSLGLAAVIAATPLQAQVAATTDSQSRPESPTRVEKLATAIPPRVPKYGAKATRLFHAQDYVRRHEAPDFWAMMPYYVPQKNERSCSVASVSMVINAIRASSELTAADELVTQAKLLQKVAYPKWAKDVADEVGEEGGGVTLEELGDYVREALDIYAPSDTDYEIEVVRVDPESDDLREKIRALLVENEQSADDFMLAVFWQATYTDDPEGETGHVAPVAAFDADKDRVLILDPDRQWYEPYWVPLDTFIAGMARVDAVTGKPRGYLHVTIK